MNETIQEYAKRLKLSWIRQHYHEIEASSNEEYLLKLFEQEVRQREERKTNLLMNQATLPKVNGKPFEWKEIQIGQERTRDELLNGTFIDQQENLIFYGGVHTGKTYLATLIGLNAIQRFGRSVKFYTVAGLGYIPLHKQGGDPILTEAVIDRLIHHSSLVLFNGPSHRYKESVHFSLAVTYILEDEKKVEKVAEFRTYITNHWNYIWDWRKRIEHAPKGARGYGENKTRHSKQSIKRSIFSFQAKDP